MGKTITKDEYVVRCRKIHGNKYDYSKSEYINSRSNITIDCYKHGSFEVKANVHCSQKQGCQECRIEKKRYVSFQKFLKKAKVIHSGVYGYDKFIYTEYHNKSKIKCSIHGYFKMSPAKHVSDKCGCPKCAIDNRTLNVNEFIKKAKIIHGDRYNYSKFIYTNYHNKSVIKCKQHGEFLQCPASHLNGRTCPICSKERVIQYHTKNIDHFKKIAHKAHNNFYDYSESVYLGVNKNINISCPKHGIFSQNAGNHIHNKCGCPKCGNNSSKYEEFIEDFLNKNKISFISRSKSIISPYEIDIFIKDYNLAIEVNGLYWHSVGMGKDDTYHVNKTILCEERGIQLLHINENEFIYKSKVIISKLKDILDLYKINIDIKDCIISEVDDTTKCKFLNKYHIQGDIESDINIGIFYKNRLVYVSSIKDNIIQRHCGLFNFKVEGGLFKMINFYTTKYNQDKVKLIVDRRWSNGFEYKKIGFEIIEKNNPNCWGFDRLLIIDPNFSEYSKNNKYWDCGNIILEKTYNL